MIRRLSLLVGPLLFLTSCALAMAQDLPATAPLSAPMPTVDYFLSLGPIGALVWGAWMLGGKGVNVTVRVELSERDRSALERLAGTLDRGVAVGEKATGVAEKATTVAWTAVKQNLPPSVPRCSHE